MDHKVHANNEISKCICICIYDDYADKTITKDTNVTGVNHRYNSQPILAGGKHLPERIIQLRGSNLAGDKERVYLKPTLSTPWGILGQHHIK